MDSVLKTIEAHHASLIKRLIGRLCLRPREKGICELLLALIRLGNKFNSFSENKTSDLIR